MKHTQRVISGLLSLALTGSLCAAGLPAAAAASQDGGSLRQVTQSSGSIGLTIRFDLAQTVAEAARREIRLSLSGPGGSVTVSLPDGTTEQNSLGVQPAVELKNEAGVPLTTEERLGYCDVVFPELPAGGAEYTLSLTGTGYASWSQSVTLDGYSKHIIVGTGDRTFSLGDVTGDGQVDEADLTAMDGQLGRTEEKDIYDLNGDGRVDITDLSYVNFVCHAQGEAQVEETAAIVSASVDTAQLTLTGREEDLFRDEGTVTLAPAAQGGSLDLPITLDGAGGVEMSMVRITSPDGPGAVQAGSALVELADGSEMTVPFDASLPEGIHAIGRTIGQRVVSIDLGRKVAVKKITIQVTAAEGEPGYAAVTKIEFLKDIVPENPQNDADQVKGVTAAAGNGQVTLSWQSVRNVTGYTVAYGTSVNALTLTAVSNTNELVVSGLENLKEYFFQVTAVNGSWSGKPSEIISAIPEPSGVPGAPSNIGVVPADQALRLSWGTTKDASFYQVFYRELGAETFQRFGGDLSATSTTLTGLTNGVTYEIAIKAGNSKGVGPYSAIAAGVPEKENLEMPNLPEEGRIDSSEILSVTMGNPNNVNRSMCPNFTTADVIDGDAATYWIARAWWESSQFTYTFKTPQNMNYAILVPYLGGGYKYALNAYTITARNADGETVLDQARYYARSMGPENYLVLTFPMVENITELSISLAEREGNGCRVSISEMAFYRSDGLADEIAALFTDGTFTQLRSGVSETEIAALSARLEEKSDFYLDLERLRDELALAGGLLGGAQDALGLVKEDFQSRSGGQDSSYGQSASDLQPLGVSARAGSTVAVYAQLPEDAPVYVVPTQFYGESGIWRGTPIRLNNGRNYIYVPKIGSLTDERGGALYLTYAGSHPEEIRLQARGGSGVFTVPVLELSGWYDMSEGARRSAIETYVAQLQDYVAGLNGSTGLSTDIRNVTEISTPSVLLSIPADQALSGLRGVSAGTVEEMSTTLYQNVLAWEDVLYAANQVQGIIPSGGARDESYRYPMTTRQNIRYMRMFAGAFMYAAGNHVGVGYGSTAALMRGRPVSETGEGNANSLFGWGIAHEIGHNMDKLGRAEITNNIYSLAVQAWDGGAMTLNTRLTASNVWQRIYAKVSAGRPGAANDVFVQLGMYWQLHLAYDGETQPLDFYNRFFTLWKAGRYSGYGYEERVALVAAETAGRDLTEFFTRWGMTLSQEVKDILAGYPAEERAIWYLNDASRTCRLSGGTAYEGTVSASAAVSENKVTLTMSSEAAGAGTGLLGYEVLRNGTPIGFTTTGTYEDDLGAANNLTYAYRVIPVDQLGNRLTAVSAGEVRIAWDKTIDAGLYTVERDPESDAVILTMKGAPVQVTGIKVPALAVGATCTVSVKTDPDEETWTTVLNGELTGTVSYFKKPGAGAEDTRLWTYDAAVVRITGLPAGCEVELLDYPGDRVDFYQDAAVGVLKEDYRYGEEDGQIIPAGTLVIAGTYRGDPVYNTIEIQAVYNTTSEAAEENGVTVTEPRAMNGYGLLFAEIPADGAVSDTSDGFWLFVPDMEAEEALNTQAGVTDGYPLEIRAVFYRTDDPSSSDSRRVTSQTLWISFPEEDSWPQITLG